MVGCALMTIALAIGLARGAGPAQAPARSEPAARTSTTDRARRPAAVPAHRHARPLDPAALHARVQPQRSADLRNPFQHGDDAKIADTSPPRDLKNPFARRRAVAAPPVPVTISPDLHNPFAKRKPEPTPPANARRERATPPPAPACATAKGVPVQRPRAVRPSAPPCPAPERAAVQPRPR